MQKLDIFIVEDVDAISLAIKKAVGKIEDFNVVGVAKDGETALKSIKEIKPALALVDIGLPNMDGIELTKQIKAALPETYVVMLTAHDSISHILNSFNAGADGYVLKTSFSERLELAIRTVRHGVVWLDPGIARHVLKAAAESVLAAAGTVPTGVPTQELSDQDTTVLNRVADAGAKCEGDVCLVDPAFLAHLQKIFPRR